MNILLADDQRRVRNALRILLEQQPGWQVIAEASNAAELLNLAESCHPDLLLLDGGLMGIQDERILAGIRSLYPQTCIIAMVEPQMLLKWKNCMPVDGCATKVNSPEHLLGVIFKCIENKKPN